MEVTPCSVIPQGTMWPNIAMSGIDVERHTVQGPTPLDTYPDGSDLPGAVPEPGSSHTPG